jgi:tetratricopeptide (TPR) repeat protein
MRKQFYSFITIISACFLFVSCAKKVETESAQPSMNPAQIVEITAQSNQLFKQREDVAKLREAVKLLASARNPNARNFEVEWNFAKCNFFLGKQTNDQPEAEKAFANGVQAGGIASRMEQNKPDGYFWYAANLGEQAKRNPVTVGLKVIGDIRTSMNKVIEIDPKYQGASAFDALAQVELASRLTGGKAEKAVEYLEKALEYEKANTYIYLHLAEAYLAVGKKDEAKKQLDFLLKMKSDPEYAVEYKETTEQAKKLLETKF